MAFGKIHLIPIILFTLILGSFIVTYIISVALDHVRPFFPYISDTGTIPPESTIFGQLLNVGAVLIFITFYIRCLEVKKLYNDPKLPRYGMVTQLNRISLWISLPVALGASMAACFQETNAIVPHMIGAFLCFTGGNVYFWFHTIISYITCPILNTLNMARLRLFLTIVGSVTDALTGLFGILSYFRFKKTIQDFPTWGPDDGGYELHLVSSFSEWLTLIFYGFYILTFVKEFKDLVIHYPKVEKINRTTSQRIDYDSHNASINPLDNVDEKLENNNGNVSKVMDIGRGGSKILLV